MDTESAPEPAPLVSGSFAIYEGPKGAVILVTEIPGRGIERKVFPGKLVAMAMKMTGARNPKSVQEVEGE